MSVYELDRDKWKAFKAEFNLSKSSFFNKADVGPTIDKFQSAMTTFAKSGGEKNLRAAFVKAQDLQKAFEKFIDLKEVEKELTLPAKAKIEKWHGQLNDCVKVLAQVHQKYKDDLKEEDKVNMTNTLKEQFPFM